MTTREGLTALYEVTSVAEFKALMARAKVEMSKRDLQDFSEMATMWGLSKKNTEPMTFGSLFDR